jgi:hypothetical protein
MTVSSGSTIPAFRRLLETYRETHKQKYDFIVLPLVFKNKGSCLKRKMEEEIKKGRWKHTNNKERIREITKE